VAWWRFWSSNLVGELLDGRYRIKQELGRGGFGVTYLALDTRSPNKRERVIKHFKPKDRPDPHTLKKLIEKFNEEKRVLERLGEENGQIPKLFDNFTQGSQFFYVQDFVDGHTLNHEMKSPLHEFQVRSILIDILEVMAFVHDNRIIHRDLKPTNIMRRKDQKIVIIDFGAVKELQSVITKDQVPSSSVTIYTEGYAPAEQTKKTNRHTIFASDVYAIGMIGIQALTGISPDLLETDNNLEVEWQPAFPITTEFAAVIKKMVRYDFKLRYYNAREALVALQNLPDVPMYRTPEVIVLPPDAPKKPKDFTIDPEDPDKPTSRIKRDSTNVNPQPFKYTGILLLVFLVGGGFYLWQNFKPSTFLTPVASPSSPFLDKEKEAEALLNSGIKKAIQKDYKGAINDWSEAIRLKPDFAFAYSNRGGIKYELGDKQGGISDLNEAIRLKPDNALAYYNRAFAKYGLGDRQGAVTDYTEAIKINRNWGTRSLADAYIGRGAVKYELGDKQGAISDVNEAIRLKPDNALAYNNRAFAKYGLGDRQGAVTDYTEAIKINRNWGSKSLAEAYYSRGKVKFDLEDRQGAISDYTEAIRLKSDFVDAYKNRGAVKLLLEDRQGAISDSNEVIRLKPELAAAYIVRGIAKSQLGDKEGSRIDLKKAAELFKQQGDTENYNIAVKLLEQS
jgi:serine/threonine protein kinase/Tfp pilus assembly protein PilF